MNFKMIDVNFFIGLFFGVFSAILILFFRLKELKNLRYKYLISQENDTRFLKDKVLEVELDFNNYKYYIENILKDKV